MLEHETAWHSNNTALGYSLNAMDPLSHSARFESAVGADSLFIPPRGADKLLLRDLKFEIIHSISQL